jgi:peptidoglycan/xylan/chitin deacetylase (PgdA/CDA1 family)
MTWVTWIAVFGAAAALALGLHLQLAVFTRLPRRALRVLMYHRVTSGPGERYAIPVAELRRHLEWLRRRGYRLVSLRQVVDAIEGGPPLPDRSVLLTFDDGTTDALELLHPLFLEEGVRGALFAVPGWAGAARGQDGGERYLDAAGLKAVAATLDIGLHGHDHRDMTCVPPEEVEDELRRCTDWLARAGVPFLPALAYPFGRYPRKDPGRRAAFLEAVRRAGVRVAFRIGNRVNPLPLEAPLEIRRTEIQGDEPLWVFKWKVRTGRRRAL